MKNLLHQTEKSGDETRMRPSPCEIQFVLTLSLASYTQPSVYLGLGMRNQTTCSSQVYILYGTVNRDVITEVTIYEWYVHVHLIRHLLIR